MRYSARTALALALGLAASHAAIAAAAALPFTHLDSSPPRPDAAQIEAELATGADARAVERRHPSVFGPRPREALAEAVVRRHADSPQAGATGSFLTRILETVGLDDAEVAQAKDAIQQQVRVVAGEAEGVVGRVKRAADTAGLLARILESIGLNDVQAAQAKDVLEQQMQVETGSKAEAEVLKRSTMTFLDGLLETIGLSGAARDQMEQQLVEEGGAVVEVKRSAQGDEADAHEAAQMAAQIEAMKNLPQVQDADRTLSVKVVRENGLIGRDGDVNALVEELKVWRRAPGTEQAYRELAEERKEAEQRLGKRHALCLSGL